jgi:hypothetical protein
LAHGSFFEEKKGAYWKLKEDVTQKKARQGKGELLVRSKVKNKAIIKLVR